jgi:XTP/dITP diphosphohydrolase
MSGVYNPFSMTNPPRRLLVATGNEGKLREFRAFLHELPVEAVGLDAFANVTEVEETGATFEENAELKAGQYAVQTGHVTLADDSGLEVEALDGQPGVLSARYGGVDMSFSDKISRLLAEIEKTGDVSRRACFVCAIAVADETGAIIYTATGKCSGIIAASPRGAGGFGYDPVFIPDGFSQTFGELNDAVKAKISHRARAFLQIMPFLRGFLDI